MKLAWSDSRDAKPATAGAAGIDRISPQVFSSSLASRIDDIRSDVAKDAYKFSPLRIAVVPKTSGGSRIIAVPTVRDRFLQRVLLRHLEKDARFPVSSSISYGFTKSRRLQDAQRRALELRTELPWTLQADIVKFFDQIRREDVKSLLRKKVRSKVVVGLLQQAVNCELEETNAQLSSIAVANGIVKGRGLRQGMPISPMLSNLLLRDFDSQLESDGVAAIRYADDIAIFATSKNACRDQLKKVQDHLAKLGLSIPDLGPNSKTKILGPTDVLEFLGIEIRKVPNGYAFFPPDKKLNAIRDHMAALCDVGRCINERRNIGQLVRLLDAFVVGHVASMAVLENPDLFQEKIVQEKHRLLRDLLVQVVGKSAVDQLDKGRLALLGIQSFEQQS
jgi:retron-type reverse transcriptase